MEIKEVKDNKKQFLSLLLLADEQENMIDKYIDRGIMYVLDDEGIIKAECIITDEQNGVLEIKNLAVKPEYQRKGYGKVMIDFIIKNYKEKYGNKYFKDLESEDKKNFWLYQLMVIDIDPSATREDIITMFNRLNLTDYNLNDQEKRNSMSGEFASLARELSDAPIWEERHLFTTTDIKRMKDVEFCASLILLYRNGIIDQTDQTALNQAYEELQAGYKDAETDKEAINNAIEQISQFFVSDDVTKFLKKKTQLYTLFSVVFYMQRNKIGIAAENLQNLKSFVELYAVFDNDMDLTGNITDTEKKLFDWLKKYKLASSEGLNKHTNRMIRFNVMKDFLFGLDEELREAIKPLLSKMQAEREKMPLEPIENTVE